MNAKRLAFLILALVVGSLLVAYTNRLYNLHGEYLKSREIEAKTIQRPQVIPEPSVYVTPTDVETWKLKMPRDPVVTAVDQCEYTKQFHLCLQTVKGKTEIPEYAAANFGYTIESCRVAAKDLAIRSVDMISDGCRGQ